MHHNCTKKQDIIKERHRGLYNCRHLIFLSCIFSWGIKKINKPDIILNLLVINK